MNGPVIDLRSDTITIPSREMLERIGSAALGDSLRDEDPTVNELQRKSALLFDKGAGLLLISGTMANQVAIHSWCRMGSIVLAMGNSHIARKEAISASVISGCSIFPMEEDKGLLKPDELRSYLENSKNLLGGDVGLVTIENSVNAAGGLIYPLGKIHEVHAICREFGVPLHIDGSRIFNSLVEEGTTPEEAGRCCDSLTFCLSKGLGAPLGSVLMGPDDFVGSAKESRNLLGGGMRQAGVIAACGIFALDHNVMRLAEDHNHARIFANILQESGSFQILNDPVQTNMVLFALKEETLTSVLTGELESRGILIDMRRRPVLRAVTSLNHRMADVERAAAMVVRTANKIRD